MDQDTDPSSPEGRPEPPLPAAWDVFRGDRLEVVRAMPLGELRASLARGDLQAEDLVRPAGSAEPWSRLADLPALAQPEPEPDPPPVVEANPAPTRPAPVLPPDPGIGSVEPGRPGAEDRAVSLEALPVVGDEIEEDDDWSSDADDPEDEDEEAAEFTLTRGSATQIEELDLAAMVDVAFQMVLFFMVTASTILYKTLEVPRTAPQSPPDAVAQGQPRQTIEDLENDYILVEVDPAGQILVDHEPVAPGDLAARLRSAREATHRTAMLLSADFATPHRNAVLAYDAANEVGLRIAIAKPAGD